VALTLKSLVRELVESGAWQGVALIAPDAASSGSPARRSALKPDGAGRARNFAPVINRKMKNGNGHRKGRD